MPKISGGGAVALVDLVDATFPGAPGAGLTRLAANASAKPQVRSGAAGAVRTLAELETAQTWGALQTGTSFRVENTGNLARFITKETDGPADEKVWDFVPLSGDLQGRAINDAEGASTIWLVVRRTGTTINRVTLHGLEVPSGSGASGQVLKSAGVGANATWGDVAAGIYDAVILNTAAQKLEFWDGFDGYQGAPGQNRYQAAGNGTFGNDATIGRTRYSFAVGTAVAFNIGLLAANGALNPRAAENWGFKALFKQTVAPVGGTVDYYLGFRLNATTGLQDGIYFRSTNGANWFLVCRSGGVETTVDMGLAPSATLSLMEFRITGDGGSVQGYVNGTLTGAAIVTNIPTALLQIHASVDNRAVTITTGATYQIWGWGWKGDLIA